MDKAKIEFNILNKEIYIEIPKCISEKITEEERDEINCKIFSLSHIFNDIAKREP